MGEIARRLELFNLAYRLAWSYVSTHPELRTADAPSKLSNSINRQIKAAATSPAVIAAEAVKQIQNTDIALDQEEA